LNRDGAAFGGVPGVQHQRGIGLEAGARQRIDLPAGPARGRVLSGRSRQQTDAHVSEPQQVLGQHRAHTVLPDERFPSWAPTSGKRG